MEIIKFFNLRLELNDQTTVLKTCFGCDEVIEPHSKYYIGRGALTKERPFHKFCGELPTEITHPLHPHLLQLNYLPYDIGVCSFCSRSGSHSDRYMYSCKSKSCEFHVDLMCAIDSTLKLLSLKSPKERERMVLKNLTHHHKLKLLRTQNRQDDDDVDARDQVAVIQQCKACLQTIIDSTYYVCTEESQGCKDYSLHRFCADLPVQMRHGLHPLHPIMLMLSPPIEHFKCFACGNFCHGHIYSCRICSFQLDIICATAINRVLEHECHQHPLTPLPRPISSFCNACCRMHQGMFYQCNTCVGFFIHEDCASLEYETIHRSHQGHPLRLGFPSDGTNKRNDCDICYEAIYDQTGWYYYCWECKFYAHLNCIRSGKDEDAQEIDPEIPRLPWEEADNEYGTVGLLNRNLKSRNREGNQMDKISHYSHPEHPLTLQSELPREANPYSDGDIVLATQCNGCCKLISAPLYSCADCHFYIHKGCALLPTSIPQPRAFYKQHDCRLLLVKEPWYETRVFRCCYCDEYSNGFSYQCEEESCNYKIDVECAFLPATIVHKAHPFHALVHKQHFKDNRFKCCSMNYHYNYVYRCDTCSFVIHTRCAMYPSKAHHRFDCDSPFVLSFNPSKIEPNEYHYCDICERQLDPKKWFYFSSKMGGQIMHLECLFLRYRAAHRLPNFKSISSLLEVDIHPHPLHLNITYDYMKCYHCDMAMEDHNINTIDIESDFAYYCAEWDCEYRIHVRCANSSISQVEIDCQETVDTGFNITACNIQQHFLEGSGSIGLRGNLDSLAASKGKEILEQSSSSKSK